MGLVNPLRWKCSVKQCKRQMLNATLQLDANLEGCKIWFNAPFKETSMQNGRITTLIIILINITRACEFRWDGKPYTVTQLLLCNVHCLIKAILSSINSINKFDCSNAFNLVINTNLAFLCWELEIRCNKKKIMWSKVRYSLYYSILYRFVAKAHWNSFWLNTTHIQSKQVRRHVVFGHRYTVQEIFKQCKGSDVKNIRVFNVVQELYEGHMKFHRCVFIITEEGRRRGHVLKPIRNVKRCVWMLW